MKLNKFGFERLQIENQQSKRLGRWRCVVEQRWPADTQTPIHWNNASSKSQGSPATRLEWKPTNGFALALFLDLRPQRQKQSAARAHICIHQLGPSKTLSAAKLTCLSEKVWSAERDASAVMPWLVFVCRWPLELSSKPLQPQPSAQELLPPARPPPNTRAPCEGIAVSFGETALLDLLPPLRLPRPSLRAPTPSRRQLFGALPRRQPPSLSIFSWQPPLSSRGWWLRRGVP